MPSMLRGYVQRHVLDIQLFEDFCCCEFVKNYTCRLGTGAVLGLCTLEGRPRCRGLGRGEPRWQLGLRPCLLGFVQFRDLFLKRLSCRAPAPPVPDCAPAKVNVSRCGLLLGRPYLSLLLQVHHCACHHLLGDLLARSHLPFGLPPRQGDQSGAFPIVVHLALAQTQAGGVLRAHLHTRRLFMGGLLARARRLRQLVSRPALLHARRARERMRRHVIGPVRRHAWRARVRTRQLVIGLARNAWRARRARRADKGCCVGCHTMHLRDRFLFHLRNDVLDLCGHRYLRTHWSCFCGNGFMFVDSCRRCLFHPRNGSVYLRGLHFRNGMLHLRDLR